MGNGIDFLAIPWENWKTNGFEKVIDQVLRIKADSYPELYPKFGFDIWTESADKTAVFLHEMYEKSLVWDLRRGPLGGGKYFVEREAIQSSVGMMGPGLSHIDIVLGMPARFTLVLTGPPGFAHLLENEST